MSASFERQAHQSQFWARLAGFLFLWLIFTGLGGALIVSHVLGSGPPAALAQRALEGEHLYRLGLLAELVEVLSALLLAFALLAILRHVDPLLALLGFAWRAAEALVGLAGMLFGYARLGAYTATPLSPPVIDFARGAAVAAYNISALCFSFGSLLFFVLFWRARSIPRGLAALGIAASPVVTLVCVGSLLFPERASLLQYGWLPMAFAEVGTGLWLLIRGAKAPAGSGAAG
ncbi:MAG: hypothetical protein QOK17_238 [Sphingomonadales bacterium]|jgi:hypothetical protein|nr:hypothetical protein [Sphingomonadales bacterium]